MKEERREKQRQTQQSVYQQRMSSSVMDAAVPAVLELGFLATSENACRNLPKSSGLVRRLPTIYDKIMFCTYHG